MKDKSPIQYCSEWTRRIISRKLLHPWTRPLRVSLEAIKRFSDLLDFGQHHAEPLWFTRARESAFSGAAGCHYRCVRGISVNLMFSWMIIRFPVLLVDTFWTNCSSKSPDVHPSSQTTHEPVVEKVFGNCVKNWWVHLDVINRRSTLVWMWHLCTSAICLGESPCLAKVFQSPDQLFCSWLRRVWLMKVGK